MQICNYGVNLLFLCLYGFGQSENVNDAAFAKIPDTGARDAAQAQFVAKQDNFSKDIVAAFTASLHHIFLIGAGLMAVGLAAVLFIKNKQLRGGVKATPGE